MAPGSDVLSAGVDLRDALYSELQAAGLSTAAFDAIAAEHLRAVQAISNFGQSAASGNTSAAYDPVFQALLAAKAKVSAMDVTNPVSLHDALAISDAALGQLVAITTKKD